MFISFKNTLLKLRGQRYDNNHYAALFQDAKTQKGGVSKVKILLPQRLTKDIHKGHKTLLNNTLFFCAFVCTLRSLWLKRVLYQEFAMTYNFRFSAFCHKILFILQILLKSWFRHFHCFSIFQLICSSSTAIRMIYVPTGCALMSSLFSSESVCCCVMALPCMSNSVKLEAED